MTALSQQVARRPIERRTTLTAQKSANYFGVCSQPWSLWKMTPAEDMRVSSGESFDEQPGPQMAATA
jgi:hypothetical protein